MPCLEASSCPHSKDTRSIGGSNQEPRETEPLLCGLSLLRGGWLLSLGLLLGSTLSLASSSRLGLRRSPEGLEKHVGLAIKDTHMCIIGYGVQHTRLSRRSCMMSVESL